MSVVVGTAGHIDHGKTTLLRALTGIDADRLPEERRRGMTIDVGYAHMTLPDGSVLDFVDVPGHDRLVGNMLVGAGEIDAALLVVAADDGPNAQTLEHLELLDALGIVDGVVAVSKADTVTADRAADVTVEVEALVSRTSLAGTPVVVVSGITGDGVEALRDKLWRLRDRVVARASGAGAGPRLAIDRVFAVKGRGTVVTGSLRGGRVTAGDVLRLLPEGVDVRVREVQVRGATTEAAERGRTALLVGGVEAGSLRRGQVLTTDPAVVATSRVLVALRAPAGLGGLVGVASPAPADRDGLRLHLGTAQAAALVVRGPREAIDLPDDSHLAILRLDASLAAAAGDRFALRRPSPGSAAGGGVILDPLPPRGVSRRRLTAERAAAMASTVGDPRARLDLHGAVRSGGRWTLAPDVAATLADRARTLVAEHHAAEPSSPGISAAVLRQALAIASRRLATVGRPGAEEVARQVVEDRVAAGSLARDGERVRDAARAAGPPPATLAAMDRLELALSVAAPPSLADTARAAGCPLDGVRALEASGRIVRLEDDLAWAAGTYRDLVKRALAMAAAAPLTPAAYRDATGTSRRYVLVILEDLDRRGLLRRTDAGHVLGPKTIARMHARAAATKADGFVTSPDVVAVVLAGGASSRFGSDKLAAPLDGRPLLHHALGAVAEVADRIIVVVAPGAPTPSLPEAVAARVVVARDAAPHGGPLAGLAAGLAAVFTATDTPARDEARRITGSGVQAAATTGPTTGAMADWKTAGWEAGRDGVVLVVGGDMPWLVPAVLRLLANTLAVDASLAAITLGAAGPALLPMAVRPDVARPAIEAILASGGRRSLRAFLDAVPSATLPAETWRAMDPVGATLRDIDTKGDLTRD